MRQTRKSQLALGEARIEDIKLDHKSRDDIPAVLLGLQHLYSHKQTREKLWSCPDFEDTFRLCIGGVRNGKDTSTVRAGVQAPDGRVAPSGPLGGEAGPRVRVLRSDAVVSVGMSALCASSLPDGREASGSCRTTRSTSFSRGGMYPSALPIEDNAAPSAAGAAAAKIRGHGAGHHDARCLFPAYLLSTLAQPLDRRLDRLGELRERIP